MDRLATVHLQPSQARWAADAAGTPPDWRLFVLSARGTKNPDEDFVMRNRVVEPRRGTPRR